MLRWLCFSILISLIILQPLFLCGETVKSESAFISYSTASRQATQTHTPLLVYISATWCGPCQKMKSEIIPQVIQNGGFTGLIPTQLDFTVDRDIVKQLTDTPKVPQFVLLTYDCDTKKWQPNRIIGYQSVHQLQNFITQSLVSKSETVSAD